MKTIFISLIITLGFIFIIFSNDKYNTNTRQLNVNNLLVAELALHNIIITQEELDEDIKLLNLKEIIPQCGTVMASYYLTCL